MVADNVGDRCNNVLWISAAPPKEEEKDTKMEG